MDNPAPPTTEHPPPGEGPGRHPDGPRVTREQVKDLGRLRRSVTDRRVGGVAGGLARHLDVDPILVRVAFVVAVFFGGAGLLAYAGVWILVPEEGTADQPLGLDERSRAVGLSGVGILALLAAVGDWAGAFWFPWPVALVALAVLWLVNRNRSSASYDGTAYSTHGSTAYDPTAYDPAAYGSTAQGPTAYDPTAYDPAAYGSTAHGPTAYDPTAYGSTAYGTVPPPGTHVSYTRAPRNPRKRGPILFWFTLALIALAEGVLGVLDAAGAGVVPSAYPALALGITAAMLLLGSFWGRAGGLILVGVVAAAATGLTTASSSWDEQQLAYTPASAAEVRDSYELGEGELVLDLSGIEDVDGLDDRDIRVDGGVGSIEVIVPDGIDVMVTAEVGVGEVHVFDNHSGGLGNSQEGALDAGTDVPDMRITIDLGVGEVDVRES